MKLTIMAATGGIGRHLVEQAVAAGHGQPTPPWQDPGDGFFMRYLGTPLTHAMFGRHYADLAVTE